MHERYISSASRRNFLPNPREMNVKTAGCSEDRGGRYISSAFSSISLILIIISRCLASLWLQLFRKTVACLPQKRCISSAQALHLSARTPIAHPNSMGYEIPLYPVL